MINSSGEACLEQFAGKYGGVNRLLAACGVFLCTDKPAVDALGQVCACYSLRTQGPCPKVFLKSQQTLNGEGILLGGENAQVRVVRGALTNRNQVGLPHISSCPVVLGLWGRQCAIGVHKAQVDFGRNSTSGKHGRFDIHWIELHATKCSLTLGSSEIDHCKKVVGDCCVCD